MELALINERERDYRWTNAKEVGIRIWAQHALNIFNKN